MIVQFAQNLYSLRSKRAAVVPFTFLADKSGKYELWVLLAVHKTSGEITDLGGGVKRGESDIEAAYRELSEESNGVFSDMVKAHTDLHACVSVSRLKEEKNIGPLKTKVCVEGITSIFLPLDPFHFHTITSSFELTKTNGDEIENLLWVKGKDILQPTNSTYKMWGFIRKFYYEALNKELLDMLYVSWVNTLRR